MKHELLELLEPAGQAHVLAFWDQLSPDEQQVLAAELRALDLDQLSKLYQGLASQENWAALADRANPPAAFRLDSHDNRFTLVEAEQAAKEFLKIGAMGVILAAGGQGTRLGFDGPKGTLPIGPLSRASLFRILIEKTIALGRRFDVRVPVYIMTSPATHDATLAYLDEHDRFGLPADDLKVFCQGTMPAVDAATGRLLLTEKGRLALSPDGHGGLVEALRRRGLAEDFQRRKLQQLFYLQIDNPLVPIGDFALLGYHLLSRSEMSTQVVAKKNPTDRVGNFVEVDGQTRIIEYSDLPLAASERRNPDGSLRFWAGSIAVHVFDAEFLIRMSRHLGGLPFHTARKKSPYVNDAGQLVQPERENSIKFERFIFDLLPEAQRAIAVEVDEAAVFAPVKNASGQARDTPESVQAQMIALHTRWLQSAGAVVDPGVAVEIGPLFAMDATQTAERIQPGLHVRAPRYFDNH